MISPSFILRPLQRWVLNVRRQIPDISKLVRHSADAVAIRLIAGSPARTRARSNRAFVPGVDFIDVHEKSGWHRLPLPVRLTHLEHRVTYLYHHMTNDAVWRLHAILLLGSERSPQEVNHFAGPARMQVRSYRAQPFGGAPGRLVRCYIPMIPCEVFHAGFAVSVRLINRFMQRDGSGFNRSFVNSIGILDIEMEAGRCRSTAQCLAASDHQHRVLDLHFRVDAACGSSSAI